jgi:hypothetical protein
MIVLRRGRRRKTTARPRRRIAIAAASSEGRIAMAFPTPRASGLDSRP